MNIELLTKPSLAQTLESQAAKIMRDYLTDSIPNEVEGQIFIVSNIKLFGQQARDVDLAVFGSLSNFKMLDYYEDDSGSPKDILVNDFFIIIDLKSHSLDMISCKDSHVFADYSGTTKDITKSLEDLRYSIGNYLRVHHIDIIVSNAIWFLSITKDELNGLELGHDMGVLPKSFNFKDIIDVIISQGNKPVYDRASDCYVLSSGVKKEEYSVLRHLLHHDL